MTDHHYISIGACAKQSGVSIRTLHYYEEIGLLVPERRANGYRVYGPEDLLRLQQILIQKSMGFALETIRACLLYTSPSPRDRTRSRMPSSA